jgi:hypothetical protein
MMTRAITAGVFVLALSAHLTWTAWLVRARAFVDRHFAERVLLAARRIVEALLYRFLENRTGALKCRMRTLLIIQESIKSSLEIFFWLLIAANVVRYLF